MNLIEMLKVRLFLGYSVNANGVTIYKHCYGS